LDKQRRDFEEQLAKTKWEQEVNTLKMAEHVTDEMHYLTHRMKQRLLYQIGLIDDPWQETDGHVFDDVYSQDPDDKDDLLGTKRPVSQGKLARANGV